MPTPNHLDEYNLADINIHRKPYMERNAYGRNSFDRLKQAKSQMGLHYSSQKQKNDLSKNQIKLRSNLVKNRNIEQYTSKKDKFVD